MSSALQQVMRVSSDGGQSPAGSRPNALRSMNGGGHREPVFGLTQLAGKCFTNSVGEDVTSLLIRSLVEVAGEATPVRSHVLKQELSSVPANSSSSLAHGR